MTLPTTAQEQIDGNPRLCCLFLRTRKSDTPSLSQGVQELLGSLSQSIKFNMKTELFSMQDS